MDLTVKIAKLNRPNLNNVVYSEECIQNVEKQILGNIIPVKLITNDFWNQNTAPVGSAQLDTALYPELHFSVNVVDPEVKKCIEKGLGGFGLCGISKQEIQDNIQPGENIKVVSELSHISMGYTLAPACDTKYEIIKDK